MADATSMKWKQQQKRYLQRVDNLQKKFPNVPREVVEESIGSRQNPSQYLKSLESSVTQKNIARGLGKASKFVAGKSILPLAVLQFLRGSPAGAGSDDVPKDPFSTNYRGGKVKRKRKKKKASKKKIMQGYKAGGKV